MASDFLHSPTKNNWRPRPPPPPPPLHHHHCNWLMMDASPWDAGYTNSDNIICYNAYMKMAKYLRWMAQPPPPQSHEKKKTTVPSKLFRTMSYTTMLSLKKPEAFETGPTRPKTGIHDARPSRWSELCRKYQGTTCHGQEHFWVLWGALPSITLNNQLLVGLS